MKEKNTMIMKKLMISSIVSMFLLTSVNTFAATTLPAINILPANLTIGTEEPFNKQEELAQFPGGDLAMQKYMQNKVNYPVIAKTQGIEGSVMVSISIDENGNLTNMEIINGIGGGCEEEVLRVLSEMPKWNPTKQAGHSLKTKQIISINFKL